MTEPELTEEQIATAKAEAGVCVGNARCYTFPDGLEDAHATCTPKGPCKVGWIVSQGACESHDVWLEVRTGRVKLLQLADA